MNVRGGGRKTNMRLVHVSSITALALVVLVFFMEVCDLPVCVACGVHAALNIQDRATT
jgi:hypothetical protein